MLSCKDGFCTATDMQREELTGNTFYSIISSLKKLKAKKYIIVDTKSRTANRLNAVYFYPGSFPKTTLLH